MLLIILVALCILIFLVSVHYYQHFQFRLSQSFQKSKSRLSSESTIITSPMRLPKLSIHDKKYNLGCCMLVPVDGENFDFFPMSFLLYLSFLTILCILIIIGRLLNYYHYKNNETAIDLLLGYSIQSVQNNSIKSMLSMTTIKTGNDRIIDYILMYGIMIISVWVSLFSFYRYFTTYMSTTKLVDNVSTKKIFSKFAIYACIFCILFILQIHVWYFLWYYWVLFFAFNVFCTYKFAAMLIKQYKVFMTLALSDLTHTNKEILRSVKFTTFTSLICCILHSINLSLFACTYNTNVIYYLPIIWSISALMLTLNFVRNRRFVLRLLLELKRNIYSNKCTSNKPTETPTKTKKGSNIQTQKQLAISIEMTDIKQEPNNIELIKSNSYDTPFESQNNNYVMPLQNPQLINKSKSLEIRIEMDQPSLPPIKRAHSSPTDLHQEYNDIELNNEKLENSKTIKTVSFKVPEIITEMTETNMDSVFSPWSRQKAFEILGVTPSTPTNKVIHTFPIKPKSPTFPKLRQLSGISKLSSISVNEMYQNMPNDDGNTPTEPEPEPTSLHLNVTPLYDERIEKRVMNNFNVVENKEMSVMSAPNGKILHVLPVKGTTLDHIKSSSEPNMDDMFVSLNILASFGFCSRASISSLRLLNKFQLSATDGMSRTERSVTVATKTHSIKPISPDLKKYKTVR